MDKKFYIVVMSSLIGSLLLLSFSFAKESGRNDTKMLIGQNNNDYRIITSKENIDIASNNELDINIINKTNNKSSYFMYLEEVNNEEIKDLYYRVNEGEAQKVNNNMVYLGDLMPFGQDGDYAKYKITFESENKSYVFTYQITNVNKNLLTNKIKESQDVYSDENNDIRYQGENPANYIKYNDNIYRIIGIIDNKIRLLSDVDVLQTYNNGEGNYATVLDYLRSFGGNLNIDDDLTGKKSWMVNEYDYWLLDDVNDEAYISSFDLGLTLSNKNYIYYTRNVVEIDDNVIYNTGDGTQEFPYEVGYGS